MKRVKVIAIESDMTITQVLHDILCREYNRPDLVDQFPEPTRQLIASAS